MTALNYKDPPTYGCKTLDVSKMLGITYRRLDYWARVDVVKPSVCAARGSGSVRRYSENDVLKLHLVNVLTDHGLNLQIAKHAIHLVQDLAGAARTSEVAYLVIHGYRPVLCSSAAELTDLLSGGDCFASVLNLRWHLDFVMAKLAELEEVA